jgi:hypothetical protein
LTKRANNAEWKLVQIMKLAHHDGVPPALLSQTPLPEQQTSILKNPLADSFVL